MELNFIYKGKGKYPIDRRINVDTLDCTYREDGKINCNYIEVRSKEVIKYVIDTCKAENYTCLDVNANKVYKEEEQKIDKNYILSSANDLTKMIGKLDMTVEDFEKLSSCISITLLKYPMIANYKRINGKKSIKLYGVESLD